MDNRRMASSCAGKSRAGFQEDERDRVERVSSSQVRLAWGMLQDKAGFVGQIEQF